MATTAKPSATLSSLLETTYLLRWSKQKDGEKSYQRGKRVVTILLSFALREQEAVSVLKDLDMVTLKLTLAKAGLSGGSINRHLAALSSMLSVAREAGIPVNLSRFRTEPEAEHRVRCLSHQEEATILSLVPEDYRRLLTVLVETGIRVGEALSLGWGDVEYAKGPLLPPSGLLLRRTKGGRARRVPLTPRASGAFPEASEGCPVFRTLSQAGLSRVWGAAKRALPWAKDDPEVVPHCLRHTCASRLLRSGAGLAAVQAWLGHQSIQTTMRYAHLDSEALDRAAAGLARSATQETS